MPLLRSSHLVFLHIHYPKPRLEGKYVAILLIENLATSNALIKVPLHKFCWNRLQKGPAYFFPSLGLVTYISLKEENNMAIAWLLKQPLCKTEMRVSNDANIPIKMCMYATPILNVNEYCRSNHRCSYRPTVLIKMHSPCCLIDRPYRCILSYRSLSNQLAKVTALNRIIQLSIY